MNERARTDDLAAVSLLDDPVRRSLYEWVVAQPEPVGREQAAQAAGVSRGLATFHLDKLARAGLLDASYQRLTGRVGPGAGRPARVYWRADREFSITLPDRRYQLVGEVFAEALERLGDGAPPPALVDAARTRGERLGGGPATGDARTRLTQALEEGGYEPMTDSHGTIRLRNCPFDALAEQHRSLVCGTNLALAEGLTAGTGATTLQPILDPQPGYCCVAFRERSA